MTDDDRYPFRIARPGGGPELRFAPFTGDQMLALSAMRAKDGTRVFGAVARTLQIVLPEDDWDELSDDWRDPSNTDVTATTLTQLFMDMVELWKNRVVTEAEAGAPADAEPTACPICELTVSGTPALMDHISRVHSTPKTAAG